MQFQFVDYSTLYFCELKERSLPVRRGGKFVVLDDATTRYAVFSPAEQCKYHANIIERFLWTVLKIQGRYNDKGDVFTFDAPDWRVEGGGDWERDDDRRELRLSGISAAYGGLDLLPLADKLRETPDLRDVNIVVVGRT